MTMTVRELLSPREHHLELLVAGDLERSIRWVHSSEMPDPTPHLEGDEVVLTAGIWFLHGTEPSRFARGLADASAAALGFGVTPSVPSVPDELVAACLEMGLTLFRVPNDVPFIALIKTFVDRYVEDHERPLVATLRQNERLVRAARGGGGVASLLRTLREHRRGSYALARGGRGIVESVGARVPPEVLAAVMELEGAPDEGPRDFDAWSAFPIVGCGEPRPWLIVDARLGDLALAERATIEQGLAFVVIDLQREVAVRESERRFAAELFDLVGIGEAQHAAVSARLTAFGLDPEGPLVGIVCGAPITDDAIAAIERAFAEAELPAAVALRRERIACIAEWRPNGTNPSDLGRSIRASLPPGSFVGVGSVARDAHGLRTSMIEALHSSRFASRRRDGFAAHDDVASNAMLLAIQEDEVLDAFRVALITPLTEHDARRGTSLVATLDLFLSLGCQYQAAARQLHVHVNSLRRRLERIEAITHRDLSSMDDRVDFYIALRARAGSNREIV